MSLLFSDSLRNQALSLFEKWPTWVKESNRDVSTVDVPTSSALRKTLRVFEQIDDVVNDILNLATAHDVPRLEREYPFTHPL